MASQYWLSALASPAAESQMQCDRIGIADHSNDSPWRKARDSASGPETQITGENSRPDVGHCRAAQDSEFLRRAQDASAVRLRTNTDGHHSSCETHNLAFHPAHPFLALQTKK